MDDEFEPGDIVIITGSHGTTEEGFIKEFHGQAIVSSPLGERYLHVYRALGYTVEAK